jgi:hypothetical protein
MARVGVNIPPDTHRALVEMARRGMRSLNLEILLALEEHTAKVKAELRDESDVDRSHHDLRPGVESE